MIIRITTRHLVFIIRSSIEFGKDFNKEQNSDSQSNFESSKNIAIQYPEILVVSSKNLDNQ